jgi:hypothetical protein
MAALTVSNVSFIAPDGEPRILITFENGERESKIWLNATQNEEEEREKK